MMFGWWDMMIHDFVWLVGYDGFGWFKMVFGLMNEVVFGLH